VLIFCFIISFSLCAKELLSTYFFANANLMPKGIYTAGINHGVENSIKGRYNSYGSYLSHQKDLSRKLSFLDLTNSATDNIDRVLSTAAFKAYGINLNDKAGNVKNDLQLAMSSNVYIFGYGLSKKENLFFIFPQLSIKTNIKSRFEASSEYKRLKTKLKEQGQYSRANYLERLESNPLGVRLGENGQRVANEITSLSNIYINYRRRFKDVTSDSFVILPAGRKYRTSDFIDYKLNDMSLGLKQSLTKSVKFESKEISFFSSYHYRSAFKMDYRIPRSDIDPLSSDIDKDVYIKYGDELDFAIQFAYKATNNFGLYSYIRYNESFEDEFRGKTFKSNRYDILEEKTHSISHSVGAGINLNTIESFLNKKFFMPADFNFQWAKTIGGKNTYSSEFIALNMMVFYK
jgi:hypothetical protein